MDGPKRPGARIERITLETPMTTGRTRADPSASTPHWCELAGDSPDGECGGTRSAQRYVAYVRFPRLSRRLAPAFAGAGDA